MAAAKGGQGPGPSRPLTALPSVKARILAFAAILTAGACGGLIGYSTTKVGCTRNCATPDGIGGVVGAILAAGGVAVVAVLVLRAMGEWRSIKETHQMEMMIAAAADAVAVAAPDLRTVATPDDPPSPSPAPDDADVLAPGEALSPSRSDAAQKTDPLADVVAPAGPSPSPEAVDAPLAGAAPEASSPEVGDAGRAGPVRDGRGPADPGEAPHG